MLSQILTALTRTMGVFNRPKTAYYLAILVGGLVLAGCGPVADQAPAEPANQAVAPAATLTSPTPTPVPPTATPAPPTATPVPAATAEDPAGTTPPAQAAAPAEPDGAATELRTFQVVAEQSEVSYQVQEEFFNRAVNLFNPIGRTQTIDGQFQLRLGDNEVQLADNEFTVDLRTLTTDEPRRDQRIRRQWLESDKYPFATFTATGIEDFPANVAPGQDVSFKLAGDMTIRDITRPQTFDVTARLDGNTFTGTATTQLLMRDYGFEPPEILGVLKVTDGVTVTVKFTAQEVEQGS